VKAVFSLLTTEAIVTRYHSCLVFCRQIIKWSHYWWASLFCVI